MFVEQPRLHWSVKDSSTPGVIASLSQAREDGTTSLSQAREDGTTRLSQAREHLTACLSQAREDGTTSVSQAREDGTASLYQAWDKLRNHSEGASIVSGLRLDVRALFWPVKIVTQKRSNPRLLFFIQGMLILRLLKARIIEFKINESEGH